MHQRLNQVRSLMEREGIDGFLLSGRPNTFYFTGFTGTTSKCLVTKNSAFLVVDFRYTVQAGKQAFEGIEVVQYEKDVNETLNEICMRYGVTDLGIEGEDLSFAGYKTLTEKLEGVKSIHNLQKPLNCVRMIKDEEEIEKIKKAVEIADRVFADILPYIKPGVREYEIALEMEYKMKKMGAKGASFETIIASGPRSAMPHGVAGERMLQRGDAVVMDFGALCQGYCSDMTRTVFIGNPTQKMKDVYNTVLKAQLEALAKAAAGMKGKELDLVSRDIINGAGYENCFGHGLGHGVGVEIHEAPTVSPRGEEILRPGMVFTVEPGIYIEGFGGVRIEDMVYLTADGLEIMTKSTKEPIIL